MEKFTERSKVGDYEGEFIYLARGRIELNGYKGQFVKPRKSIILDSLIRLGIIN